MSEKGKTMGDLLAETMGFKGKTIREQRDRIVKTLTPREFEVMCMTLTPTQIEELKKVREGDQ